MKLSLLSLVILAMPVIASAAAIPKNYHGQWLQSDEVPTAQACAETDSALHIKATGYAGYEFGCSVKKVTPKNNKAIVVNLLCGNEMGDYKDTVMLSINQNKQLQVVNQGGTAIYYACPKKGKR